MNSKNIYILPIIAIATFLLTACNSNSEGPGLEYMPDMYRSPAVEEYVDYGEMRDFINDSVANRLSAMVPPLGTIPFSKDPAMAKYNFPYPYPNTSKGYMAASNELTNPIHFDEAVYDEGKVIFGKFCIHCHGPKGEGQGSVIASGAFPPPPAYSRIIDLTDGKMFHTLMYGKGNMGSHSSQLNKHELWTVAHYVRTLRDKNYDYASTTKVKVTIEETPDESGDN